MRGKQDLGFKRSIVMTEEFQGQKSARERVDNFTLDLEANLKNFNDKFMETLTKSLADQLFDISKEAKENRRNTVG